MFHIESRYSSQVVRATISLLEVFAMYELSLAALKDIRPRESLRELDMSSATRIKDTAEKQFALLVLKRLPTVQIFHEPYIIILDHCLRQHNNRHATIPDFLVVRRGKAPLHSGIFVEVTHLTFSKMTHSKPKTGQKAVMREAQLNNRYVQVSHNDICKATTINNIRDLEEFLFQGKLD